MRSLLLIIFLLFNGLVFSQVSGSAADKKDSENKSAEAEDSEQDTIIIESRKESAVRSEKSVKGRELKPKQKALNRAYESENELEETNSEAQSTEFKNAAISFEYSKERSEIQRTQRSPSARQQAEMDDAVGFFEENSPNSFEFNYFKYSAGNHNLDLYPNLNEAERLRPNNSDVQIQLTAYHIIAGNKEEATNYMNKLVASNRLEANVLKYSGDILRSVPLNGTLITHGFDDTYGVWYMQQVKGVRRDVKLVSLDFLQSPQYRTLLSKSGYVLPELQTINTEYLSAFCGLNRKMKLAISLTTPKEYFKSIMENVYVTGLVFEYHSMAYDNFQRNVGLWDDELKKELVGGVNDEKAKQLSANYLPMLLQMRKVYKQEGDLKKVSELDKFIDRVAVQCKKYDQVQHLKRMY